MSDPEIDETEGETEDEYECVLCDKVYNYQPKRCECGNHTFNLIKEPADDPTEEWDGT